jgi:hypothetical protein
MSFTGTVAVRTADVETWLVAVEGGVACVPRVWLTGVAVAGLPATVTPTVLVGKGVLVIAVNPISVGVAVGVVGVLVGVFWSITPVDVGVAVCVGVFVGVNVPVGVCVGVKVPVGVCVGV